MKGGGSPEGSMGVLVDVLPSMPKGETIGNIVIDGKGAETSNTRITSDSRGNREVVKEEKEQRQQKELMRDRHVQQVQ